MPFKTCTHIKTDGNPCGSPAVRNQDLCHYHGEARDRAKVIGRSVNCQYVFTYTGPDGETVTEAYPSPGHNTFNLGLLDDPDSIQLGISAILHAITTNTIDLPRADRLLYGLKLAAANIHLKMKNLPANTTPNS